MHAVTPVAPHAGAWIETFVPLSSYLISNVAPHAGAWIETPGATPISPGALVAPHAGAWIETPVYMLDVNGRLMSRLTQARGLKQFRGFAFIASSASRLTQARGLKHQRCT